MHEARRVATLLALFTARDRAESIAGDLTEERLANGTAWFWLHAVRTAFALFTNTFATAPFAILGLAALGLALFVSLALTGQAARFVFPYSGPGLRWAVASIFWWSAALWTGVSLVRVAPRNGMAACLTLAVCVEAFLVASPFFLGWSIVSDSWPVLAYGSALIAGASLVSGGAIARWRSANDTGFKLRRILPFAPILLAPIFVLLLVPTASAHQATQWHDPSPHTSRRITVADGVQLEVLDWGGSGQSIVLLAGLGDTAHVYDDFAPMLATQHRVYGITRRGHPNSSAPAGGYEFARLSEDVIRVVRALALSRPIIAGHSIAGEELHVLGSRYAAEVAGLVYLDAAFDRSGSSKEYAAVAVKLPAAPVPETKDLASVAAFRAFQMQIDGAVLPEAHVRARYAANADGRVGAGWMPALEIRQAFTAEIRRISESYNPKRIRVPALALYAVPGSPADLMRHWYRADDPAVRRNVARLYELARERFRRHADWFEAFAADGRVAEISGAHHLFLTNPREVLREVENFAASIQ